MMSSCCRICACVMPVTCLCVASCVARARARMCVYVSGVMLFKAESKKKVCLGQELSYFNVKKQELYQPAV